MGITGGALVFFLSQIAGYQAEFLANVFCFVFDKTAAAFSKLAIFSFSLCIVLFRDSTFPLTNVRSSFLVEHFESLIRDIKSIHNYGHL